MYVYRFSSCGDPANTSKVYECYELNQLLTKLYLPESCSCKCELPTETYLTKIVAVHHTYLRKSYWALCEIAYWDEDDYEQLGTEDASHGWMWRDRRSSPECEQRAVMALNSMAMRKTLYVFAGATLVIIAQLALDFGVLSGVEHRLLSRSETHRDGLRIGIVAYSPIVRLLEPYGERTRKDTLKLPKNATTAQVERVFGMYVHNWMCYSSLHGYTILLEFASASQFDAPIPPLPEEVIQHYVDLARPDRKARVNESMRAQPWWGDSWMKPVIMKRYLGNSDWLLWIDTDVLFFNLAMPIETVLKDAGVTDETDIVLFSQDDVPPNDVSHRASTLCSCVFMVRNSAGGRLFLEKWYEFRANSLLWDDQGPFMLAVWELVVRKHLAKQQGVHYTQVEYDNQSKPPHFHLHQNEEDFDDPPFRFVGSAMGREMIERGIPKEYEKSMYPVIVQTNKLAVRRDRESVSKDSWHRSLMVHTKQGESETYAVAYQAAIADTSSTCDASILQEGEYEFMHNRWSKVPDALKPAQ